MALAVTSKTHNENFVAASTFTTASITVPIDSIAVIVVFGYDTTNNGTKTPTLSSTALSSITNLATDFDFHTIDGTWCSVYWGRGTGTAATVSIPWTVSFEGCAWEIFQVSPDAGNTVDVLQGTCTNQWSTTSTPMTLTLSALTSGSAVISGEFNWDDTASITPGTGYTELYDTDSGSLRHHGQYRLDPVSATVSATSATGAENWGMGAFEVIERSGAPLGFLPVGF